MCQAFWTPYSKFSNFIEEQVTKFASNKKEKMTNDAHVQISNILNKTHLKTCLRRSTLWSAAYWHKTGVRHCQILPYFCRYRYDVRYDKNIFDFCCNWFLGSFGSQNDSGCYGHTAPVFRTVDVSCLTQTPQTQPLADTQRQRMCTQIL